MQIAYLGPLEVRVGGDDGRLRVQEVPGRRLRALLGRLALDAGAAVSTGELVTAVWGDGAPAEPAGALQALVSRLRRALGAPGAVEQSAAGYRLRVQPDDVDATRMTRAVLAGERSLAAGDPERAARELGGALDLLRGDPLPDSDDEAAAVERSRVAALADRARSGRAQALLALGRPAEALAAVVPGAEADPLREDLARWRMAALAGMGRDGEALVVFERTRAALAEQLGADPSAALAEEHLRVLRGDVRPSVPASAPPSTRPGATAPANLPARASSFLGRGEDTDRLRALLAAQRLVTVLGPGGAGKTSLAVETARAVAASPAAPAGGVWLVELAPVAGLGPQLRPAGPRQGSGEVDAAVAVALGLREAVVDRRRDPLLHASTRERLLERLDGADVLVVLDNCEHVVAEAAELVAALLARCPGVRVLATSREPLAVDGEHLLPLAPLAVPAPGATAEQVAASPAVRLLAQRAAAAGSDLPATPSPQDPPDRLADLAEVARRLDGLPLALELAAARLRTLTPAEVVERLDDRFRLLTAGRRTAAARHRTLRAVVEWSWDLLEDAERDLAELCAVFAGGVTAPALAEVSGCDAGDAADRLRELADRSLLVPHATPRGTRYRMLETLREYGRERLAARGALVTARDRHAAWAGALLAEADAGLRGRDQRRWVTVIDEARDDLVAALAHLVERGDGAAAVDLAVHLAWYGSLREDAETFRWSEVALTAEGAGASPLAPVARAVAQLHRLATAPEGVARPVGGSGAAQLVACAAALAPARGAHPAVPVLEALLLGFAGRADLAARAVERGLAAPDPWTRATVRQVRAALAENVGDLDAVRADVAVALPEWEALGDDWGIAAALLLRGQLQTLDGDVAGAVTDLERARTHLEGVAGTADQRMVHLRLADLRSRSGDVDGARRELEAVRGGPGPTSRPFALLADASRVTVELRAGGGREAAAALEALETSLTAQAAEAAASRAAGRGDVGREHGLAVALAVAAGATARSPEPRVRARAPGHLADAHRTAAATDDGPIVASVTSAAAEVALAAGEPALAAALLAAGRVLRGGDDLSDPRLRELAGLVGEPAAGSVGGAHEDGEGSRERALGVLAGAVEELAGRGRR